MFIEKLRGKKALSKEAKQSKEAFWNVSQSEIILSAILQQKF